MRTIFAALAASLALASAGAGAAVLYKLVDPLGNVTFTDTLPRSFVGEVTRLDVDTGTNVLTPSPAQPVVRAPVDYDLLVRRPGPGGEERLLMAAERIDAARAALENARANSVAEDWYYYRPNPVTGASRAPRPEYLARLARLEGEVAAAEEAYDALRWELR